jgi:uncharacterized protein YkwD
MKRELYRSFAVLALVVTIFASVASSQSGSESEVFLLVNRERAKARLGKLTWDDRLAKLARDYSSRMAREGFFDHYDRRGKTVIDRAESARIVDWERIGENLFVCDAHELFTQTAVRGWLRSTTHRTNMLDREWTTTGIGIATARDGSIFVTQVFTQ